jgi:hypothetical protein
MIAPGMPSKRLLAIAASILILGACASPADRSAMTPQNLIISKHHPYSLGVQTSGGAETGALDSSNIANADLKAAIELAVTQSQLFKRIVSGNDGDYELSVRVISLSKPLFGGTFTVDMETAWSLTKVSDRSVAMRKSVKSSGTATMSEAFAAVTRLRLAVEAASRNNIEQGIKAIAELNL